MWGGIFLFIGFVCIFFEWLYYSFPILKKACYLEPSPHILCRKSRKSHAIFFSPFVLLSFHFLGQKGKITDSKANVVQKAEKTFT